MDYFGIIHIYFRRHITWTNSGLSIPTRTWPGGIAARVTNGSTASSRYFKKAFILGIKLLKWGHPGCGQESLRGMCLIEILKIYFEASKNKIFISRRKLDGSINVIDRIILGKTHICGGTRINNSFIYSFAGL